MCLRCAAKYFLCHLSLNKCIYGDTRRIYINTHTHTFYRFRSLLWVNNNKYREWNGFDGIPNLCGTDLEWQKRHICVHETYRWKKSSLMTYAHPFSIWLVCVFFSLVVATILVLRYWHIWVPLVAGAFVRLESKSFFFFLRFCSIENDAYVDDGLYLYIYPHLEPVPTNGHKIWYGQLIQLPVIEISVPMVKCLQRYERESMLKSKSF